uniref:Uncharacterized protein n=1 Tax=Arundo donax TaxID=35708 RepID=A0A0A9EHW8_ARUDO
MKGRKYLNLLDGKIPFIVCILVLYIYRSRSAYMEGDLKSLVFAMVIPNTSNALAMLICTKYQLILIHETQSQIEGFSVMFLLKFLYAFELSSNL